jgi:hypothetical protein
MLPIITATTINMSSYHHHYCHPYYYAACCILSFAAPTGRCFLKHIYSKDRKPVV